MTGSVTTMAALCAIIADVIGVDRVGPGDGFFEVGGDSVLAVRVVALAREEGLVFSVRDLFDHQTPEALVAVIDDRPAEAFASADGAAEAEAAESPLLTYADGEFGEFEDDEADQQADWSDAEWETIT
jgi:Phosphopantetheine attachment site